MNEVLMVWRPVGEDKWRGADDPIDWYGMCESMLDLNTKVIDPETGLEVKVHLGPDGNGLKLPFNKPLIEVLDFDGFEAMAADFEYDSELFESAKEHGYDTKEGYMENCRSQTHEGYMTGVHEFKGYKDVVFEVMRVQAPMGPHERILSAEELLERIMAEKV